MIVASPLTNLSCVAVKCEAEVPSPVGKRVAILEYSPPYSEVPNSSSKLDIKLGNEIKIGWNSDYARALDPK